MGGKTGILIFVMIIGLGMMAKMIFRRHDTNNNADSIATFVTLEDRKLAAVAAGPVVIPFSPSQVAPLSQPIQKSDSYESASWQKIDSSELRYFKDVKQPLAERKSKIEALGRQKDPHSVHLLMAIAEQKTFLSPMAIAALGHQPNTDAEGYLSEKLKSENYRADYQTLVVTMNSYVSVAQERAVPALIQVLQNNQARDDGYEQIIKTEAVQELGKISTPDIAPVLISELANADKPGFNLEYGSAIVKALVKLDSPITESPLRDYATLLSSKLPMDPMAQKYFQDKILETRTVGGGI